MFEFLFCKSYSMNLKSNIFRGIIKQLKNSVIRQEIRCLPRWSQRRSVQVIAPDEYDEITDTRRQVTTEVTEDSHPETIRENKIHWRQPLINKNADKERLSQFRIKSPVKPLTLKKSNVSKDKPVDMLDLTIDQDGNFIYTKMNDNDSRISQVMLEVKSKKEKEKKDLMLLEGKRLIKEALVANCKLEYILFSQLKDVEYLKSSMPKMGAKLFKMPYKDLQMWSELVTNPGIMGIFKIPDTESYEPSKALPITVICDNIREPSNLGSVLRTACGVGCKEVALTKGCTNLWDTKVLRAGCGGHFKLRIKTKLDWEKIREEITEKSRIFIADNNDTTITETQTSENAVSIPIIPYYGVNFLETEEIVLIIGGETQGISQECYQFAAERNGVRLNVPLSNDVDSLNTNTAFGIIAFEIKRQILTLK